MKNVTILAIEDSENDQALIMQAFKQNGVSSPIRWASGGEEAIAYLKGERQFSDRSRFPYPSIIMTDLKMPKGDGFSVLEHLKSTPDMAVTPAIIFSSSIDPDDIKRSYMLGAASYLVKPQSFAEMRVCLKAFFDYWMWCKTPERDYTGRIIRTEAKGKLGERFSTPAKNDES